MNEKLDVLIVGAGPTGLVMAHELARDGVGCRIIDKSAHASTHSKAIAIHARTLEVFELMTIVDDFMADWRQEPSLAQCQALVDERGPGGIGLADPRWISVFRIHRREAARFRQGRVFLAGDAAHIHSPVGGQGMNAGIRDAFNLGWKLGLVAAGLAAPELLDSYEAERKPADEAVIRQTDRATRLVSLHGSVTRFVRDHAMSLLTRLPAVEAKIGEAVSGIAVDYRGSPIVEDHPIGTHGPHAGDRAPDAPLADAGSAAASRLYHLFAEHRHVLLLGGAPPLPPNEPSGLPERYLTMHRIAAAGTSGADLIDCQGAVAAQYGSAPAAYLIRPDGYVGMRSPASEAAVHLPRYFAQLCGSAFATGDK